MEWKEMMDIPRTLVERSLLAGVRRHELPPVSPVSEKLRDGEVAKSEDLNASAQTATRSARSL